MILEKSIPEAIAVWKNSTDMAYVPEEIQDLTVALSPEFEKKTQGFTFRLYSYKTLPIELDASRGESKIKVLIYININYTVRPTSNNLNTNQMIWFELRDIEGCKPFNDEEKKQLRVVIFEIKHGLLLYWISHHVLERYQMRKCIDSFIKSITRKST